MSLPKISILIPAYNAEEFIETCIESALRQSYKNVEVIVRNDGSSDKTLEKMERFSAIIGILDGPNVKPAIGRNMLFQHSTGDIIHFHDADDLLNEEFCQSVVDTFERNPRCKMGIHGIRFIGRGMPPNDVCHNPETVLRDPIGYVLSVPLHVAATSYRRELLAECDPVFDHRFIPSEDWELNLRLLARGERFANNPNVLKICVRRERSFSSDSLVSAIAVAYMLVCFVNKVAPENGLDCSKWANLLSKRLYRLGDTFSQAGYPANAREAWRVAASLDPEFDFGNRWLNRIESLFGAPLGFLAWSIRRDPLKGLRAFANYVLYSRKAAVRLGS